MTTIPNEDEYIHQDYPRDDPMPWKENWYFNFIDKENNAWGFNHISLERHNKRGRFSAIHVIDGEIFKYVEYLPLGEDFTELNDGKLHLEFIEPHKKFRLRFNGPSHSVDLNFLARFEVFDYAPKRKKDPQGDKKSLAVHHYEQALTVNGTLTKDGATRNISCFGHRDHSWGYRNEMNIAGWNWIAAQFADQTINIMQVRIDGIDPISRGFISAASGNTTITQVKVLSSDRNDQDQPVSAVYEVTDEHGKTFTMTSKLFSNIVLPPGEQGENVTIYENFSTFTLPESGDTGTGIDEYLENSG